MLSLTLADKKGVQWAQEHVARYHYLGKPVHAYSRPIAYLVLLFGKRVGCLIFGRPEATRCAGWYGSVEDVITGRCPLTRWQILNLSRVWLDPSIQRDGAWYHPQGYIGPSVLPGFHDRKQIWHSRAASYVIDLALERVVVDYLLLRPPVWMNEPYQIKQVLSYCDTRQHTGTLYRTAHFTRMRSNTDGMETYAHPVRSLTSHEIALIERRSQQDPRCQRLRAQRMQLSLW